jgi:heterotetrameric sarcosine oxidase gamma subunit
MTNIIPIKQSPIYSQALKMGARFTEGAGWLIPSLFSMPETEETAARSCIVLADASSRGKVYLEGQTAESILSLPPSQPTLAVGQGIQLNDRILFRLRADQFFISTAAEDVEMVAAELTAAAQKTAGLITATDMTHGRSQLLLVGPKAAELLGRLCGLDFHDQFFPNLAARHSSVAKTRQLILRHDFDRTASLPVYSLIGACSLAPYLWETIIEAGRDRDIIPIGQHTVNELK